MAEPVFVETWVVVVNGNSEEDILDIAYTKGMFIAPGMLEAYRHAVADSHNCILRRLLKTKKIEFMKR